MKITILGCGSAGGVPLIGDVWGACDPAEPKNRRTRVSVLIEEGEQTLLIDTSPDMREQLLRAGLKDLSAVFYTHGHADHTHGIDNLRSVNWLTGRPMPIYASAETMADLRLRFDYIFAEPPVEARFTRPSVEPHILGGELDFHGIKIRTFKQEHGVITTLGYRFNDFAFTTDACHIGEDAFEILKGVKVWVVGAIRERPHPTHAHVARALEWIERIGPQKAYLTHMDHSLDYASLKARLPEGVEPAYDGLEITC